MTNKPESDAGPSGGERSSVDRVGHRPDREQLLLRLEARISTLTRQIMGMERTLANMDGLGAETQSAQEAIACAYQLLGLYRKRRVGLLE